MCGEIIVILRGRYIVRRFRLTSCGTEAQLLETEAVAMFDIRNSRCVEV